MTNSDPFKHLAEAQVYDVFAFECEGTKVLYAPLDKLILKLSPEGYALLLEDRSANNWKSVIDPDNSLGLFLGLRPESSEYVSQGSFDGLVFLVTSACNLKCKYCYAEKSQKDKGFIKKNLWQATLDYFFDNLDGVSENIGLAFHGYGECTLFPNEIIAITEDFSRRAAQVNRECAFQITTNGTFSHEFTQFLIAHDFFVNLSLDGPPAINDIMRITKRGKGSYAVIKNNIRELCESTIRDKVLIRATFTPETVHRMAESFEHFHNLGVGLVHVEPAYLRGAATSLELNPRYLLAEFSRQFRECVLKGNNWGMKLMYGPINFGLGVRFCSHKSKLVVDYAGRIVSCVEAGSNSGLGDFHYGNIFVEHSGKDFDVLYESSKIDKLNALDVGSYPNCETCLLKYHCAGNCPASLIGENRNIETEEATCAENEKLFAWILARMVNGEDVDALLDFPVHRVW